MFVVKDIYKRVQLHIDKPVRDRGGWSSGTFVGYLPENMYTELTYEDEPVEVMLTTIPKVSVQEHHKRRQPKYKIGDRICTYDEENAVYIDYGLVADIKDDEDSILENGDYIYKFENGHYLYESEMVE